MDEVRCFVAIELGDEAKAALAKAREGLVARTAAAGLARGVKWVEPPGIHLTLKFLGNVAPELIPRFETELRAALSQQRRFALRLGGLGVFPSPRSPRVVWVGVTGDLDHAKATQLRVEEALSPLGFPTEARAFTPHLTLARVREEVGPAERRVFGEIVAAAPAPPSAQIPAMEVSLMRSELSPKGASYSRIFAITLG